MSSQNFKVTINTDQLSKGLRPSKRLPRNSGYLTECVGAVGRDGVLQTISELTRIATTEIVDGFPYPQIFVFTNVIIVCGSTKIYEWVGGALVLKLTVAAGSTWRAVDFGEYIYMSNRNVAVIRSATEGTYSETTDLPSAMAMLNFGGQVVIGAPSGGDDTVIIPEPDVDPFPVVVTWNPDDRYSTVQLSNGNLTAGTDTYLYWDSVRATVSKSSGKWYWEVKNSGDGVLNINRSPMSGLADAGLDLSEHVGTTGWGLNFHNGEKHHGITVLACLDPIDVDDVLMHAWNADTGDFWFGRNGTWAGGGNPATGAIPTFAGVIGTLFPTASLYCGYAVAQVSCTANFGASAFAHAAPAGFLGPAS